MRQLQCQPRPMARGPCRNNHVHRCPAERVAIPTTSYHVHIYIYVGTLVHRHTSNTHRRTSKVRLWCFGVADRKDCEQARVVRGRQPVPAARLLALGHRLRYLRHRAVLLADTLEGSQPEGEDWDTLRPPFCYCRSKARVAGVFVKLALGRLL